MNTAFARGICRLLIVCMAAFPVGAYAGLVPTDQVAALAHSLGARDQLQIFISRSEVRSQLENYGVSPAAAQARISAMTDAEVASLSGQIDRLPAGGVSEWAAAATLLVIGLIWYYWVK